MFYDKLEFIYIEIAKFDKSVDELKTMYDKWLFVLKNLSRLENRPATLRDKIFDRLFKLAEIARLNPAERYEYEDSLKSFRDLRNCIDYAEEKGIRKGMAKGLAKGREEGEAIGLEKGKKLEKIETARNLKRLGVPIETIATATGLSTDEITTL